MATAHALPLPPLSGTLGGRPRPLAAAQPPARDTATRTLFVRRGGRVYATGDEARHLYVLRAGRIRTFLVTGEGRRVVIETITAPSLIGEAALTPTPVHATDAEAVDDCELLVVDREAVEDLLAAQPNLALRLLAAVSTRLQSAAKRLEDQTAREAPARLAGAVLQFARAPHYEAYPVKQAEIAELAGTSRETATRVLNQFEAGGLLSLGRTRIRVLQPDALAALAGTG